MKLIQTYDLFDTGELWSCLRLEPGEPVPEGFKRGIPADVEFSTDKYLVFGPHAKVPFDQVEE
jgi:hypothetical protein